MDKKKAFFAGLVLMITLVYLATKAYQDYKYTFINQQNQFLLAISKNISLSIERYVDEIEKELNFLGNVIVNEGYDFVLDEFYKSNTNSIYTMFLLDSSKELVYKAPAQEDNKLLEEIQLYLSNTLENQHIEYRKVDVDNILEHVLIISSPIYIDSVYTYELVGIMKINDIYNTLIEPIEIGAKGYTLVKDSSGIILMHPFQKQVGMNVIDDRKTEYKGLDFTELEELVEIQLKGEEGFYFYNSYWWEDEVPQKVKKLNGFAPANIGDDFWIVATTLDYKELNFPIHNTFITLILFVVAIFIILLIVMAMLIKLQRDKVMLAKETKHLKELNATLEDLQKSKQQLSHRQKLNTIGTFTSGIAHEFNNLLTPIMGYSEMILDKAKDTDIAKDVNEIYKASIKAKEIIEQVLIYSRRNKNQSSFKYVNINKIIDDSIGLIEKFIDEKIYLVKEIKLDTAYIYANETQISQMLINIYTNACQAMKKDGGILYIKMNKEQKQGSFYLKITVKDTGCGISEENLEHIFEPFYTTKPEDEGTGLGLSVVESIVISHKGEIKVNSKLGIGSEFIIYLPIQENVKNTEKSILLADSNKKNISFIKKILSEQGYKVYVETNVFDVVNSLEYKLDKYDIVIIDFSMLKLEDIHVGMLIKKRNPNMKVILMTEDEDIENESFIDEQICKPINAEDLLAAVGR